MVSPAFDHNHIWAVELLLDVMEVVEDNLVQVIRLMMLVLMLLTWVLMS